MTDCGVEEHARISSMGNPPVADPSYRRESYEDYTSVTEALQVRIRDLPGGRGRRARHRSSDLGRSDAHRHVRFIGPVLHESFLKSFAFTVWVFAFVSASMVYPGAFMTWLGVDLKILIVPLIQIIMFGMGTTFECSRLRPGLQNALACPRWVRPAVFGHEGYLSCYRGS